MSRSLCRISKGRRGSSTTNAGSMSERAWSAPSKACVSAYVELGAAKIELMEPSRPDSPIAKFLERNPKGGIHHFCLGVDDVGKPRMLSLRTACACWAPANRNATSRASPSPSSIPAIFWAHWSSSKSTKGEERHEDQACRADRGQLSHEKAGLHGGRPGQTGRQCAPAPRNAETRRRAWGGCAGARHGPVDGPYD